MSDDKTPPTATGAAATASDVNTTAPEEDPKLMSKIQVLEQDLANAKLKIKNLEDEKSSHESDIHSLISIAAKTSELESQISSLQHELISSASEFEAKQRENAVKMSLVEFERNLLRENLKDFQTGAARGLDVLQETMKEGEGKISLLKAKRSELEAKLSALEAGSRKREDEMSQLKAMQRELLDQLCEQGARFEASECENWDKITELKAILALRLEVMEREKSDKVSELEARLEASEREKSDKVSELEARLKATEREKLDKISELQARLKASEREKLDKISELEARLEAAEREKRIKLIH